MVVIARSTTWASLQTLTASALNSEFNVVFNAWNNADAGTGLWNNVKISSSASNPMECKSSAVSTEFDIDCTGTNGTPIITWRRSGSTLFTFGVNGAASNIFNFGTTSLTTNIAMQIPSTGVQVIFNGGGVTLPGVAIGLSNYGHYWDGANIVTTIAGTAKLQVTSTSVRPATDNTVSCGEASVTWSNVYSTLLNVNAGPSDGTTYIPQTIGAGGGATNSSFVKAQTTTTVGVGGSVILTIGVAGTGSAGMALVWGSDGTTAEFCDMIMFRADNNVAPTVVTTFNSRNAPAARTYSAGSNGQTKLAMASGSYSIKVLAFEVGRR